MANNDNQKKIKLIKIMKVATTIFSDLMILIFTLTIVFLLVQSNNNGKKEIFGYQVIRIVSDSMEPTLSVNDVILIQSTRLKSLEEGDIITYLASEESQVSGYVVTHRVVSPVYFDEELNAYAVKTKGDKEATEYKSHMEYSDIVTEDRLYGIMTKKLDVLTFFMSGGIGRLIFLFALPLMVFIGVTIFSAVINKRKQQQAVMEKINEITSNTKKLEEEIARKAVEEFLRNKQESAELQQNNPYTQSENSKTPPKD